VLTVLEISIEVNRTFTGFPRDILVLNLKQAAS